MIKVVLLDDEKTALDELEYFLSKHKEIEIVASFTDPVTALEEIGSYDFDAVFLDIGMPVINGLNAAKELIGRNSNTGIVFVTAYNDYAVKAFEINAMDYILKPVEKDRLDKTVARLLKNSSRNASVKKALMDKLNHIEKCIKQDNEKFAAFDGEEIVLLKMCNILYLEAEAGRTSINTSHGKFNTKETLDSLNIKLNQYGFFRCHRSYIINLRHISKLSPMFNNSYVLQLEGSCGHIPVSRNRIKELKKLLGVC